MATRHCGYCGESFEAMPSKNRRFCSRTCAGLARHKREMVSCRYCGQVFETLSCFHQQFCSRQCADKAKSKAALNTLNCEQCGQAFTLPRYRIKETRFCSRTCAGLARRHRDTYTCAWCGESFEAKLSANHQFCNNACQLAARAAQGSMLISCAHCGEEFKAKRSDHAKYCSLNCSEQAIRGRSDENAVLHLVDEALGYKSRRFTQQCFPWLKNPDTGRHLRLDGWYPDIPLAVEVNGRQHYHQTRYGNLQAQQRRDAIKATLLASCNIPLLTIRYDEPRTLEHIKERLAELGF